MTGSRFLEGYSGQTTDELVAMEKDCRLDSLVLAFEQALQEKTRPLSDEERVILAVEALEREVNNGGYAQFFTNLSKEYAPVVVEALRKIGCPLTAENAKKAIDILRIGGPPDEAAIDRVMAEEDEARDDRLNQCDAEYCGLRENIAGRLFEFIRTNRVAIRVDA